jgi:hypothetical protein
MGIKHRYIDITTTLLSEQKVKNGILHELEHPTHSHTKEQIKSLKKYALSPSTQDNWKLFMEWSNNGPKVYDKN